jgi:hypothetical protein
MGKALGIDSYLPHELSLSLGGCEVCIAALLLNRVMIKIKIDTCMCASEDCLSHNLYTFALFTHMLLDCGVFQCSKSSPVLQLPLIEMDLNVYHSPLCSSLHCS